MNFIEFIFFTVIFAIVVAVVVLFIGRKPIPNIDSDVDIKAILANGDKLKAIKAYRQLHGVGLKKEKQSISTFTWRKFVTCILAFSYFTLQLNSCHGRFILPDYQWHDPVW